MSVIDDTTQLDLTAAPMEPVDAKVPEVIIKEAQRRRRRRWLIVGSAFVLATGAVLLFVATAGGSGSSQGEPPTSGGRGPSPSPTPMSQPPVEGYTPSQAASIVSACSPSGAASVPQGGVPTAVLADAATDSNGTTFVIASATGWSTCVESANGTYTPSLPFQTYGFADGWGPSPPSTPAAWLFSPAEGDWAGGGYVSKGDMTWLQQFIGRASINVAKVAVTMPDGTTVSAPVQNGFFLARESFTNTPSSIAYPGGPFPYVAYDSSGGVLYNDTTSPHASCVTTASGAPVSPAAGGTRCQVGTPWGVTYLGSVSGN